MKIADFGLARDIHKIDYYRKTTDVSINSLARLTNACLVFQSIIASRGFSLSSEQFFIVLQQ